MRDIKAVLCDLDGTLLDTLHDIAAAANQALARYGLPTLPTEAYRAYVGHGIRELFTQALPAETDAETYEKVLSSYLAYYPEHCTERSDPFPGVMELLRDLEGRCILGVLSNKTEKTARKIISHYFPDGMFRLVWGNDGKRPLKPDPAAGPLLCDALSLRPEQILFFGDGDTDMEFAVKAGFLPVACSWGYRDRETLKAAGALRIIDSADELREFLA